MLLTLLMFYSLNVSKPLEVNVKLVAISFLVFLPLVAISFFDTISGYEIEGERFYFIFKGLWLATFILFVNTLPKFSVFSEFQLRIMSLFVSIPVFLSVFMYFIPSFDSQLTSFYGIERFPLLNRFGGVFGIDVNALGMYATLTLILSLLLMGNNMFVTGLFIFSFSLFCIMLSGMRTGLLVTVATSFIFIFNKRTRLVSVKNILISLIVVAFLFTLFIRFSSDGFLEIITNRFSLSRLGQDVNGSDDGNLGQAINYFKNTLGDVNITGYNILSGVESRLIYVDNFYIYLFLKYGVYPLIVIFIASLKALLKIKNVMIRYLIIFSLIVSCKGIFVIGNYYVILTLLIICVYNVYDRRKVDRL
ncbi:hypothetical protein Q2Y23_003387 [Vibrio fluvialis]|nr:hypothetical protein [Vibrio fluvialis]